MGTPKINILAISGSTKSKSTSQAVLEFIKEMNHDVLDLNIYNQIADLPHFNPDLESQLSASVLALRSLIEKADGILFCTPEYVYSLPGSLKNMIEWNVSTVLFSGKPMAMIVAAASGQKAFESLGLILSTLEADLREESKLLISGAKGKIGVNGRLNDPETAMNIDRVMSSLLDTISAAKAT